MTAHPCLQRRSTGYYFRLTVPSHLRSLIGKKEIVQSLKTNDAIEAKKRISLLYFQYRQLFDNSSEHIYDVVYDTELLPFPEIKQVNPNRSQIKSGHHLMTALTSGTTPTEQTNALTLAEVLQSWAEERGIITDEDKRKDSTYVEKSRCVRVFIEQNGNLSVSAITADHIKKLKHYYQNVTLTKRTINKYLGIIKSLLNYAIRLGALENISHIPDVHWTDSRRQTTSEDKMQPFNVPQLQKLFTSPLYTGYIGKYRHKEGKQRTKDALYWLPLIGLFTGMRIEEISQLTTRQIKQEGEIYYFHIKAEHSDQKLKTNTSTRNIPIHYELINCGLLDYWKQLPSAPSSMLFPDLTYSSNGKWSKNMSRDFGRYLDYTGVRDKETKLVSFHSFRHSFKDATRRAPLPPYAESLTIEITASPSLSMGNRLASSLKKNND